MKPLKKSSDYDEFAEFFNRFETPFIRLDKNCQAYGKSITKRERRFIYKLKRKSFKVLDSQKRLPFFQWIALNFKKFGSFLLPILKKFALVLLRIVFAPFYLIFIITRRIRLRRRSRRSKTTDTESAG